MPDQHGRFSQSGSVRCVVLPHRRVLFCPTFRTKSSGPLLVDVYRFVLPSPARFNQFSPKRCQILISFRPQLGNHFAHIQGKKMNENTAAKLLSLPCFDALWGHNTLSGFLFIVFALYVGGRGSLRHF